jgi:hypothetical protein
MFSSTGRCQRDLMKILPEPNQPILHRRAVWNISSSCFNKASLESEEGSRYVPRSFISKIFLAIYWEENELNNCFQRVDDFTYIMISVEQHKQNADCGRQKKEPVFSEHIGMKQSQSTLHPNFVVIFIANTIERG